ncbi:Acid protease [Mycena kentingensis (nom. inval.)]|nr:Acid protease [Mycena kentingensis (nom. inval.)]
MSNFFGPNVKVCGKITVNTINGNVSQTRIITDDRVVNSRDDLRNRTYTEYRRSSTRPPARTVYRQQISDGGWVNHHIYDGDVHIEETIHTSNRASAPGRESFSGPSAAPRPPGRPLLNMTAPAHRAQTENELFGSPCAPCRQRRSSGCIGPPPPSSARNPGSFPSIRSPKPPHLQRAGPLFTHNPNVDFDLFCERQLASSCVPFRSSLPGSRLRRTSVSVRTSGIRARRVAVLPTNFSPRVTERAFGDSGPASASARAAPNRSPLFGILCFGGVDKTQYTGDLTYVPLNKQQGIGDTGTTLLVLPTESLKNNLAATGEEMDETIGLLTVTHARVLGHEPRIHGGTSRPLSPPNIAMFAQNALAYAG